MKMTKKVLFSITLLLNLCFFLVSCSTENEPETVSKTSVKINLETPINIQVK